MDTDQFVKDFSDLGTRFMSEYARNVERYLRFVSGMAQQPAAGSESRTPQDRFLEFVRNEGPKASKAVAQATLNYYTAVLNTGIEAANRFMDQVVLTKASQPSAQASRQTPALLFNGKHGESPSNAFLVTNNRDEVIQIRCELTEVVSEVSSAKFSAAAKFTPESCQLGPRSEQMIQCSIPLTEQFQEGETYGSQIRVVGFPEMTMKVSIHVDEAGEPLSASEAKAKKKR
jgi:hypothetical protein